MVGFVGTDTHHKEGRAKHTVLGGLCCWALRGHGVNSNYSCVKNLLYLSKNIHFVCLIFSLFSNWWWDFIVIGILFDKITFPLLYYERGLWQEILHRVTQIVFAEGGNFHIYTLTFYNCNVFNWSHSSRGGKRWKTIIAHTYTKTGCWFLFGVNIM